MRRRVVCPRSHPASLYLRTHRDLSSHPARTRLISGNVLMLARLSRSFHATRALVLTLSLATHPRYGVTAYGRSLNFRRLPLLLTDCHLLAAMASPAYSVLLNSAMAMAINPRPITATICQ
jgi:hypothetical protein